MSQEFGKGSLGFLVVVVTSLLALHHKNVLVGWPPTRHGSSERWHLTGAFGWEVYCNCQAEHQPAASPAGPPQERDFLHYPWSSREQGSPEDRAKVTGAFCDSAFETLEVTKYHVNVFYWSK